MAEQFDRRAFLKRVGLTSLVLATPYILTSCSTPSDDPMLEPAGDDALAEQFRTLEPLIRATNPHIQSFNSSHWGFSTVEFTFDHCEYTAYSVDKAQNRSGLPAQVIKRFRVPSGRVPFRSGPSQKSPLKPSLPVWETKPRARQAYHGERPKFISGS